ncbi:MAG: hypothetical protein DIU79_03015 [Actinobacteria bacterium]|nr:MAG: hypothetical protein DIU79_03015 [Actinomycetota bacterium]
MTETYFRRVGALRPSHLMYTAGIGALVDLPNFTVLVRGLDHWDYSGVPEWQPITETRLLAAVRRMGFKEVEELRPAPWLPGLDQEPTGSASRVGVPVMPFPSWLRCTACQELAPRDAGVFDIDNSKPRKPHEARFYHVNCHRKTKKKPLAVPARFVLACTRGHLDDFPYPLFVHRGAACPSASHPRLRMEDRGGNLSANVEIRCIACGERRNMREVIGAHRREHLPHCRGRRPQLDDFDPDGCSERTRLLVIGASNQWFPQTLSVLAVPRSKTRELQLKLEQNWSKFQTVTKVEELAIVRAFADESMQREFAGWTDEEIWAAIQQQRARGDTEDETDHLDLLTPEWEVFTSTWLPEPSNDFTLRRDPVGVPAPLKGYYADVIQVERLREVRALIAFTRLDAPDPEDPDLVHRAPIARDQPTWVPATEVRGEGIFLRLPPDLLREWEERVSDRMEVTAHKEAYARYRRNRYSGRIPGEFDEMRGWPGIRYYALHTLSHLLIRTIALECGYSAASLAERIYTSTPDDPDRAGILIYTAVPDAEGTLGGLVSLAEPDSLVRLTRRALSEAHHCSSDPLCAERLPRHPDDFLHGAACHICLFVSETTCERGNRFLDRRFVVPVGDPELALFPHVP